MLWGNRLYRMFIKPTKFHNTALLFGLSMVRFVSRCKITTFPQTRKGIEKILLQRIVFGCILHELPLMYHELSLIGCFTRITVNVPRIVIKLVVLHELPLMYHELSLIGCFTRIAINVPRIVINCFEDIASGCGWLQQPCHADVGLRDGGHLWLRQTGIRPSQYKNPTLHIGVW